MLTSQAILLLAAASDPWAETFFGLDEGKRFVLMIIAIGCATGIIITAVTSICGIVESVHRRRLETEMKREMLDRGMSAEEIARVVESAQPKDFLERWAAGQGKAESQ
jgi:hypothetical protein